MADILLGNVKGPQGNTGATGSQGPQGEAATITVGTVSTTAYGNTASVTNSGTEQDAVLDFVIPQGKPGEQTTRMGALTLDTVTAQSADFPIPAVGETGSTVFGKIIKFFNSTISALNSKLNISDVVNNLTSTSTTQPLSAAQGKALNDALGTLGTSVTDLTDRFFKQSLYLEANAEYTLYYKNARTRFPIIVTGAYGGAGDCFLGIIGIGSVPSSLTPVTVHPIYGNSISLTVNIANNNDGRIRLKIKNGYTVACEIGVIFAD